MNTKLITEVDTELSKMKYNLTSMAQEEANNWKFTCVWAVFYKTKQLAFELEYIGPKKLFRKNPKNTWINEADIELVWLNVPIKEEEQ